MDKRFEQIDKRFEQVDMRIDELRRDTNSRFEELRQDTNKRFDELRQDMNKRFEQVDRRFEELISLFGYIVGAFAGVVAITIGFALWDRRTTLRPIERRVDKIEGYIDGEKISRKGFLDALRDYASRDSGLKELLKTFSML
jgi:hypothetical protein